MTTVRRIGRRILAAIVVAVAFTIAPAVPASASTITLTNAEVEDFANLDLTDVASVYARNLGEGNYPNQRGSAGGGGVTEPTRRVPDGGATLALLGVALFALGALQRKL